MTIQKYILKLKNPLFIPKQENIREKIKQKRTHFGVVSEDLAQPSLKYIKRGEINNCKSHNNHCKKKEMEIQQSGKETAPKDTNFLIFFPCVFFRDDIHTLTLVEDFKTTTRSEDLQQ